MTRTKREVFPVSEWGLHNFNVPAYINSTTKMSFDGPCSLDVENDERDGSFLVLGIYDGAAYYGWTDWELAKQVILPPFIAHNGASDLRKLQKWGFKISDNWLMWDTELIAHILDSSRKQYGLTTLSKADLNISYPSYEDICGNRKAKNKSYFHEQPLELVLAKNQMDCYVTYKLFEKQKMTETEAHYFQTIEQPVSFIFHKMQERGCRIDRDYLQELCTTLERSRLPIETAIQNEVGKINLNSPKQLLEALHEKGIKPTLKGKSSTDKRALESLRHLPLVSNLLSYSEIETLLASFVKPYLQRQETVVHPFFNQCGTRTGRPSCSNPNLLQIPRRTSNGKLVRKMFVAQPGWLLGNCDYGQGEPRIMAHMSKDQALCEMFTSKTDFHTFTDEKLKLNDREKAKVLNLSVGYRATYKSVSQQLKCTENEAQKVINDWWNLYPGLWDWQEQLIYDSKRRGYFETLMGRRIRVDGLNEYNKWKREAAQRQLLNNIAQASLQEVMKKAMILVDQQDINILVQVYDELLFEERAEDIQVAFDMVCNLMESAVSLDVPMVAEGGIGKNWGETKG